MTSKLTPTVKPFEYPPYSPSGVELDDGVYALLEPGLFVDWDALAFIAARESGDELFEFFASSNKNFKVPAPLNAPSSWAGANADPITRYPYEIGDTIDKLPYQAFYDVGVDTTTMKVWRAKSTFVNGANINNPVALPSNVSHCERWEIVNSQSELVALAYYWVSDANKKFNLCLFSLTDPSGSPLAKLPLTVGLRGSAVQIRTTTATTPSLTIAGAYGEALTALGVPALVFGQSYSVQAATEITGTFGPATGW